MEQLAEQVQEVINHFKIVKYIGIAISVIACLVFVLGKCQRHQFKGARLFFFLKI